MYGNLELNYYQFVYVSPQHHLWFSIIISIKRNPQPRNLDYLDYCYI